MPLLELAGRSITYRIGRGKSRNYVYLRFRPDLTLDILLPMRKVDISGVIRKKETKMDTKEVRRLGEKQKSVRRWKIDVPR